jgi:hypothetical protein
MKTPLQNCEAFNKWSKSERESVPVESQISKPVIDRNAAVLLSYGRSTIYRWGLPKKLFRQGVE